MDTYTSNQHKNMHRNDKHQVQGEWLALGGRKEVDSGGGGPRGLDL